MRLRLNLPRQKARPRPKALLLLRPKAPLLPQQVRPRRLALLHRPRTDPSSVDRAGPSGRFLPRDVENARFDPFEAGGLLF